MPMAARVWLAWPSFSEVLAMGADEMLLRLQELLDAVKAAERSRRFSLVRTKLEEAKHWLLDPEAND
jgi:hypothetical protein